MKHQSLISLNKILLVALTVFWCQLFFTSNTQATCYSANDIDRKVLFDECISRFPEQKIVCPNMGDPEFCCTNVSTDSCDTPPSSDTISGTWQKPCGADDACQDGLECTSVDGQRLCCADGDSTCTIPVGEPLVPPFDICKRVLDDDYKACHDCVGEMGEESGVWTGLGCIHFQPTPFIKDFMKIALGVAGGIALLLMIYGSFLLSVSTGDPKKAQEGKEVISGTIAGLLFIIFSVFLLKLIGVDILEIPGF